MEQRIRVDIIGRDDFWGRAFHVEWEDQFPDRKLTADTVGRFLVRSEWLDDLQRVADQTFCKVVRSPENPLRRQWISSLIAGRDGS